MILPWSEKYRACSISGICSQTVVTALCKRVLEEGLPLQNLLFSGDPGTGKSSTAIALCTQMFGDNQDGRVLQVKVSEDGGIDLVRTKIKYFTSLKVNEAAKGPTHKVIILDEADGLTFDAQAALRNLIESSSHNTRFILLCNTPSKILTAIVSRCVHYRFLPIDDLILINHLQNICKLENIPAAPKHVLTAIAREAKGDMRKALNLLQGSTRDGKVDEETWNDLSGRAREEDINLCLQTAAEVLDGKTIGELFHVLDAQLREGTDPHKVLIMFTTLSNTMYIVPRLHVMKVICDAHVSIKNGCDDILQLSRVALAIAQARRSTAATPSVISSAFAENNDSESTAVMYSARS